MLEFLKKTMNKPKEEVYMGLALRDGAGLVMLIKITRETEQVDIIEERQFKFTNSWENLIEDVDEVLYQLEKKNGVHTDKVILFLYSHLVDQKTNHIKKPYINTIRALAKEMELKLMGFVEFHEAIALNSNHVDGMSLTAAIIEVDTSEVTLFVYKGGKLVNTLSSARTEELTSDLEELFQELKGDFLPTKIILYDALDVGGDINSVLTYKWKDDLFVQIPQVEIVPGHKIKQNLLQAFGLQLFGQISQKNIGVPENVESSAVSQPNVAAEGFVVGEDIRDKDTYTARETETEESYQPQQTELQHDNFASQRPSPVSYISTFISMVFTKAQSLFSSSQTSSSRLSTFAIIASALVVILGSIISLEYFFHKATVTLFYKSPSIDKELTLGEEFSLKKVEEKVTESESAKTTGKKTIGDKAKGGIILYNLEKNERLIKSGTVFVTDNGIKFTLNAEVKIASASSSTTSGGDVTIVTGKQNGSLTAVEIGKSGNIGKGVTLHADGVSVDSLRAATDKAFSGGTEEEVQTVSKADLESLTTAVEEKIKKKGDSIVSQKTKGARVVKELTEIEITQKKFSKEIAQEATEVSLQATAQVTFYMYNDEDLKKTVASTLSSGIEKGYELTDKSISYTVVDAIKDKDSVKVTIKITAKPELKFDESTLKKEIAGKSISNTESMLKEKYSIDHIDAEVKSLLPFLNSRIPFFSDDIQVITKIM